jgi:phage shock protein A
MQRSIHDLEKGIARTIVEIEEAKSRLQKATAQHEKYTQALKAISALKS